MTNPLNAVPDLVLDNLSLGNDYSSNGALILKDNSQSVIDSTPTPSSADWHAGSSIGDVNKSMERNDDPTTGWHTCNASGCLSAAYWDSPNTQNYGTPGAENLSENDPSSKDYKNLETKDKNDQEENPNGGGDSSKENEEKKEQDKNGGNNDEEEENNEGDNFEGSPGGKETLEETKEKEAPSEEESKKEENSEGDSGEKQ